MGKGRYLLKRFIYIIFVFFIISILMFFIYKIMPGDPVTMMLGDAKANMKPDAYQRLYEQTRESLGLNSPLYVQYIRWIGNMLTGNFGYSTQYKTDVINMIGTPMLNTVMLNLVSMLVTFLIAVPLGIATAVRRNTVFDKAVQVVTIVGYSLPSFIIALLAIFAFAVKIPIFPISGVRTAGFEGNSFQMALDTLWHMALPVIVMSISGIGSITRYVRAAMIDVLRMDYIKTARSKGLREKVVIYVHAFRNALIPVVTIATAWVVSLFGGSIVIENVFLWPGLGQTLINGLMQRDFSVVLTMQMFYVVLSLAGNVIMDIAYTIVDPRVRLRKLRGGHPMAKKGLFGKRKSTAAAAAQRMVLGGLPQEEEELMQSPARMVLQSFVHDKVAMTGLILFLIIFLCCIILPFFYPIQLSYQDVTQSNVAPGFGMLSVPSQLQGNAQMVSSGSTFSCGH